jgi:hypothetical protein
MMREVALDSFGVRAAFVAGHDDLVRSCGLSQQFSPHYALKPDFPPAI